MPFIMLLFGAIMLVVAFRGNQAKLGALLKKDFSGEGNFFYWLSALCAIGAVGYVPQLRIFSRLLIGLVMIVLVLATNRNGKGGFFDRFTAALGGIKASAPTASENTQSGTAPAPQANGAQPNGLPPGMKSVESLFGLPDDPFGAFLNQINPFSPGQ